MIRALGILAAVAALAVSAPASAATSSTKVAPSGVASFSIDIGTTEKAKGLCDARGFMDYTDDACVSKLRWSPVPSGLLSADHNI